MNEHIIKEVYEHRQPLTQKITKHKEKQISCLENDSQ